MMNIDIISPPYAPCTVRRAHDQVDNFTAYEIEVDGQSIELDRVQLTSLTHTLTTMTGGN